MSVTVGISIATQVLGFLGLQGTDVLPMLLSRGGDKKRRLDRIETLAVATTLHASNALKAAEVAPPEVQMAIKDGVILTLSQALATITRAADLDGSSSGLPS